MQKLLSGGFSWKFAVFLCVVVCFAYHFFVFERATVDLKIVTKKESYFKIYWAKAGQHFSENRMAQIWLKPELEQYNFSIPSITRQERLRIDTHEFEGTVAIKHLEITQNGGTPIRLSRENAIKRMQPLGDVKSFKLIKGGVRVESSGSDPIFEVILLPDEKITKYQLDEVGRMAILCMITLLVYAVLGRFSSGYAFVPVCLMSVLVIVMIMAVTSKKNVHPDEFVHTGAVNYYKSNWLPPKILDEKVRNTYSPYGVSRLNGDEIYYLIAGKFAFAFERMFQNPYTACRMFNVLLLLSIILYLVNVQQARVMALPLLISPQIWYLYSYCNSEAFALTVLFFTSCQVVLPDSSLRKYFEQKSSPDWVTRGLMVGLLLASMPLLKKNFIIYTAFFVLIALVSFYQLVNDVAPDERAVLYRKLVALVLVTVSLYGGKKIADYTINGPNRNVLVSEAIAAYARPYLHPDTSLEKQLPGRMLRKRGVTLKQLLGEYRWLERSFQSSFGLYGYLNTPASQFLYKVFGYSALLLAMYFFGMIFFRGSAINKLYTIGALGLGGLLICISAWHSWNNDFQAQGRYLFPSVGMLFILCGQNVKIFSERWLSLLVVWMFCLSSYSYISVALLRLPRNYLL